MSDVYPTKVNVREGQSIDLICTLRDQHGDLVPASVLSTITATLFRTVTGVHEYINDRQNQDVFNANGGQYYDDLQTAQDANGNDVTYNFLLALGPDDTPFLKPDTAAHPTEIHSLIVRFNWPGAPRGGFPHKWIMTVTNYEDIPVEAS